MAWEVDWSHEGNTGEKVWARNPTGHSRTSREWHWVRTGMLRQAGVQTPVYRRDSWEVNWSRRNGKQVWARNPSSKMPGARDWHWIDFGTLEGSGIRWRPVTPRTGRSINTRGYYTLSRLGMTDEEVALCDEHGIWLGARRAIVLEHRLIAFKKYGHLPTGTVVRHLNGNKLDNRPENLVRGSTQENTMDHDTARLMTMYWRERCEKAEYEMERIRRMVDDCRAIEAIKQAIKMAQERERRAIA